MRILVLGSGGREHALAWRLARDPGVSQVIAAPGNPGIARVAACRPLDLGDPAAALNLARAEAIDLTVVGPEAALERGVADLFRQAGAAIVGPSASGSALECSKVFAKHFMETHGIPTARFRVCDAVDDAIDAVSGREFGFPVVVKADGLAGGKGVVIAANAAEARDAVRAAMEQRQFGAAGARLVIEECLTGPEVSFFVLADGARAVFLGTAQDHKRIFDDDRGPNTGGMGAFSPSPFASEAFIADVMARIVAPVIDGFAAMGDPYVGFLYVSLMLTPDGPKVIEFNVRFGDPEAQVVLPLIEDPLAPVLHAAALGRLTGRSIVTSGDCAVGVVLASAGYPASADTGREIHGIAGAEAEDQTLVFHAGTRLDGGRLVTAGGRVLTVVGRGPSFDSAMSRAYAGAAAIHFDGMQYRRDIGRKAIGCITSNFEVRTSNFP